MADDSKRLVELNTQLADLADKSSQLEKELQKIKMAGQGIGTTLPHNFRKASSAVDQLISRMRELETAQNRVSTSGGAIGASKISAAHATLTGLGRGGGGYGSSGIVAERYPRNPLEVGGGLGIGLGGLKGTVVELLKKGGGMLMGGAYQAGIMAMQARQGFEQQTRFLQAGSLDDGIGTLGNLVDENGRNVA